MAWITFHLPVAFDFASKTYLSNLKCQTTFIWVYLVIYLLLVDLHVCSTLSLLFWIGGWEVYGGQAVYTYGFYDILPTSFISVEIFYQCTSLTTQV